MRKRSDADQLSRLSAGKIPVAGAGSIIISDASPFVKRGACEVFVEPSLEVPVQRLQRCQHSGCRGAWATHSGCQKVLDICVLVCDNVRTYSVYTRAYACASAGGLGPGGLIGHECWTRALGLVGQLTSTQEC